MVEYKWNEKLRNTNWEGDDNDTRRKRENIWTVSRTYRRQVFPATAAGTSTAVCSGNHRLGLRPL